MFQSPLTASRTLFTTFSVACLILPEAWSTLPSCFSRSSLVITPAASFTRPLTCPYQKFYLNRNLKQLHELTLKWGEK